MMKRSMDKEREHQERWAVVGGGILGLTLALRLREQGKDVTIIEDAPEIGGLAAAWTFGEVRWDKHYHVTLLSDSHTRQIAGELGLAESYRWTETKTGFFANGQLSPLSSSLDYLRLPALTLLDKLRLAATILYASRVSDWQRLEQVTVVDWLTRLSGRRVFERLWKPLLQAKLGENYRHASAVFIWAVISRLYAARRTGLKKELFGYIDGGYGRFFTAFDAKLRAMGVDIRTSHRVRTVRSMRSGGFTIEFAARAPMAFDHIVLTCPSPTIASLVPELRDSEKQRLSSTRYQGIVCASLLMDKPLAGYYLTYITDDAPFTAVVEMSALVAPACLNGKTLVYLPRYLDSHDEDFSLPDEVLRERFLCGLERIYPNFSRADVLAFTISRAKHVLAIPTLHYSKQVPELHTSIPGLYVANSAQIVDGTLNVNETVKLAERTAERLRLESGIHASRLRAAA